MKRVHTYNLKYLAALINKNILIESFKLAKGLLWKQMPNTQYSCLNGDFCIQTSKHSKEVKFGTQVHMSGEQLLVKMKQIVKAIKQFQKGDIFGKE